MRPHENLAARLIGYTSHDNTSNLVGIEGAYDSYLKGVNGVALMQKLTGGSSNVWMPVNDNYEVDPKDGMDIVTTIDINFQDVAEKALLKQLVNQDADHGCAVLMEVETGEIKAIVNLGKDKNGNYREIQNYAIYESVEPGSTFKLPVIIAALEDGYIELEDTINTENGLFQYSRDKVIKDENYWKGGSGWISVKRAFEVSSNIAMVKIISSAYKGYEGHFIDRLTSMRLNEKLGIEIKGEGKPFIKYPDDKYWSGISLGMIAHGYEVRMTPLQILTFYNAIANDSKMVKPKFVKEIRLHGRTVKTNTTEVLKHSVCSRSTLKKARILLEGVVENGTASNIKNKYFKIAGKTGTSQIFNTETGSYRSETGTSYQASFAGYFPADEPKYSCIVVVNSPSKNVYHGNEVAGPVFAEIANKVYSLDFGKNYNVDKNAFITDLPYSKDGFFKDLENVTDELNLDITKKGVHSDWIVTQRTEDKIVLQEKKIIPNLVPNVVMMGAKDAVYLLENSGLKVIVKGRGSVKH
ncbi:MAG: peptidoglycan glycosyltransferase, partial [Bacteroidales bacterium]|nr:peptidoglycan glycosyltransferase [Bacteroidales bacterium]